MKNRNQTRYRSGAPVRYNQPAYPNAADNSYFAQKALDILTAIVSGMGVMFAMVFLLTLA